MTLYVSPQYPGYDSYSEPEDISVGSSPFELYNSNGFGVRVFINGGLLTNVEYHGQVWASNVWKSCGPVQVIDLNPHDTLRVTYGLIPPAMAWTAF